MTSGDAVRLIRYREHLVDLELALLLIGYRLAPDDEAELPEPPAPSDDMVARVRLRALVSRTLHHVDGGSSHPAHGWTEDDPGVSWHWPMAGQDRSQDWRTRFGTGSLVPWVAPARSTSQSRPPAPLVTEQVEPPIVDMSSIDQREPARFEPDDLLSASLPEGLFGELLRRKAETKRIDVGAVVAKLARLEPVTTIPRLRGLRSAKALQIVHDIGLFNGPYGSDLRDLCTRIAAEVPPAARQMLAYKHRLSDGCGTGPVWTWRTYRPPHSTSAVVVFVSGGYGRDPLGRQAELEATMRGLQRRGFHTVGVWLGSLPTAGQSRSTWLVVDA